MVTNSWTSYTTDGVTSYTIYYPGGTVAHAYRAAVKTLPGSTPQNMVSSTVQLNVGLDTRLLMNITRDFNSTRHVFNCKLFCGSSPVTAQRTIKLKLNQTREYSNTTVNGLAEFVLWLSPQTNNDPVNYNVVASFGGDSNSTAKATYTLPNGTIYTVCQTIQYNIGSAPGYKPSANSTSITIRPQTTDGATTLMDMAAMQADAQTKGLQVWGPDSWSILPPFLKLHAKVVMDSLGMVTQIWGGFLACGVDNSTGLGTLLLEALKDLSSAAIDIAVSAIVSVITTVYILYWSSIILASFLVFTVGAYLGTLAYYCLSLTGLIAGSFYLVHDVWLSKALLYGMGFALFGLILGAFWNDPQARIFSTWLRQQFIGGDPAMNGAKYIVNSFLTGAATASSLLSAGIIFKNTLMWPFAIATFIAGVAAIYAGTQR